LDAGEEVESDCLSDGQVKGVQAQPPVQLRLQDMNWWTKTPVFLEWEHLSLAFSRASSRNFYLSVFLHHFSALNPGLSCDMPLHPKADLNAAAN